MRHTGALLKDVPAAIRDRHSLAQPIIPLIMCGGAGTRLWPASREGRPKQFLPLFGPHSTFQETIRRVSDPALFGRPIVVTNNQYRFVVAEQLAAIGAEADIMLEPMRRDSGLRRHTPMSQTISNPRRASASHSESGTSASRTRRPRRADSLSSHVQVLIS